MELCGSGKRAEGRANRVPVLTPSPTLTTDAIFLGLSTSLHMASAWRKAIVPPSHPTLRSSCPVEEAAARAWDAHVWADPGSVRDEL